MTWTWGRERERWDRRCQGTGPDGDECDCREEVRWDRLARRWLCRWCWSRVDATGRTGPASHGQETTRSAP